MPYRSNSDLPPSVQAHVPPHTQDIYREAFNHAFAAHVGDPRQEEAAHRIAWAAVKRSYVKVGGSSAGSAAAEIDLSQRLWRLRAYLKEEKPGRKTHARRQS